MPDKAATVSRPSVAEHQAPEPRAVPAQSLATVSPTNARRKHPHSRTLIVSSVVLVCVLAMAGTWALLGRGSVQVLPAVGTATVSAASAQIVAQPSPDASAVFTVRRGERVNISRVPGDANPAWVAVQFASGGRISRPGYLRSAALSGWSPFALLRAFRPLESAGIPVKEQYVAELQRLVPAESGETANALRLEIAEYSLELARAAKDSALPADKWIDTAADAIALVPAGNETAAEIRTDIDNLRRPPDSEATDRAVSRPKAYSPEPDYRRAEIAWRAGNYVFARRLLKRILSHAPRDARASALLDKVNRAQSIDPGVRP